MKVLIVHPQFYLYGGGELVIKELSDYLDRNNVEHDILTSKMISEVRKGFEGKNVIIPHEIFERKRRYADIMCDWVREHKDDYDVINYHNHPVQLISKFVPHANVWQCNEPSPEGIQGKPGVAEVECAQRYLDNIIVFDEYNAMRCNRLYDVNPIVNYYGINHKFFSGGDAQVATDKYKLYDDFVVLHAAMIHPEKGQLESVKAISELKDKIPNIRLLLVGWDHHQYADRLREIISSNKLSDKIQIYPHIPRTDLINLYARADVLVQPCTDHGGWLVPFEALSAKLPVIVSETMTSSPIIRENHFGVVSNDLVKSIQDVKKQYAYYKNRAKKASKWIKTNLTWDKYGDTYMETFKDSIEKRK